MSRRTAWAALGCFRPTFGFCRGEHSALGYELSLQRGDAGFGVAFFGQEFLGQSLTPNLLAGKLLVHGFGFARRYFGVFTGMIEFSQPACLGSHSTFQI